MQLFEKFPSDSRIWIYQCNRPFTSEETERINSSIASFTKSWTAHNNQLKAGGLVVHNRFIILCVDENMFQASGCSIDKSTHLIRETEKEYKVFLFNRLQIAYLDSENVIACPLQQFITLYEEGKVNAGTMIFNNTITHLSQVEKEWLQRVDESWINAYLPVTNKRLIK
jgi:hypothetical protein